MAVEDRIKAIFVRRIIFWGCWQPLVEQQLEKIHSFEIFALYLLLLGKPALELVDM
ncbi:hypothetical protein Q5691_17040 [Microcoleus sp. w1-18aA5]|uniref:hypothetical protein n=1 Tax=unclassified Microcoleus TaxID=2642155 RepID=UPI002FD70F26